MGTIESGKSARRESCDLIVIGAGVIGLAAGWRAAQRGLRTLVLEAGEPGRGSTGVAAGMLAPVTEATFGERELLSLSLEAARCYPQFVAELEQSTGVETGFRPSGTLAVALDRDQAEEMRRLHEFQRSLALESEWLNGRECRRLEPGLSPSVVAGIRSSLDHHVTPRSLTLALERALELAGGRLRSSAPVRELLRSGERVEGVLLHSGERIAAPKVVLAAGWQSAQLTGLAGDDAALPLRPVKGQILTLRSATEAPIAGRVVRTPEVYLVPRPDGELVVGATVEERGLDSTVTAGGVFELLRAAYEALPGITELELTEARAGLRPGTPDNRPIVGPGALDGLVWASGHYRNGILLAGVTADAVAELVAGGELQQRFAPFSPRRFDRSVEAAAAPGGAPRR